MPMSQGMTSGVLAAWAIVFFIFAGSAVVSYFLGCFNGSVIVSKYILKDDVRNHGSGNAGLTNFHRTFGGKLTAVVLALDILKMVLAVFISMLMPSIVLGIYVGVVHFWDYLPATWMLGLKYWAGMWCLLGHMFPCTFGFKGGKGILSGVTLLFLIDWRMGLISLALFVVIVALTRYISLGSICATASFPVTTFLFVSREPVLLVLSVLLAALIIWMHRGNIKRLLEGTENKFSLHRKEK